MSEHDLDVAILGAGTAGMTAYRQARKYTGRVALIDGGTLGTTCARVGCMPSKLLIAAANARHAAQQAGPFGLEVGDVGVDGRAVMKRVREERDRFVGFVRDALEGFDQSNIIRQNARFADNNTLVLEDGSKLTARATVIATGSRPHIPEPFEVAGDRLITNDDLFDREDLPASVAVFGAGVIGLELGQALHRLGVRVRLFELGDNVGAITDPDVRACAQEVLGAGFPALWNAETEIDRDGDEIVVTWTAGGKRGEERFDYILAATGRRPNLDRLGLENTTVEVNDHGIPLYDRQSMRAGDCPIYIAGDAAADLPLLHEAADEGRIAGENAAHFPDSYRKTRRVPLSIVFSDPQIAVAGESHADLTARDAAFRIGSVSFEDQGRARVMRVNQGLLRVYGCEKTGLLLGAEMFGPAAEHIGHLLSWVIADHLTVEEILDRPFYHPVIEEGVRTALRNLNTALGFAPPPPARSIDCGPGG